MSMDMIKSYSYGYSAAVTQFIENLNIKKLVLGLVLMKIN